ncbi:hypothetical protein C8R45DRAFT_1083228 [Mycena sanguinolenta]|nr:hypothetical protein C8R45DRAFT_1083228 [Mycena sanguinolenta]
MKSKPTTASGPGRDAVPDEAPCVERKDGQSTHQTFNRTTPTIPQAPPPHHAPSSPRPRRTSSRRGRRRSLLLLVLTLAGAADPLPDVDDRSENGGTTVTLLMLSSVDVKLAGRQGGAGSWERLGEIMKRAWEGTRYLKNSAQTLAIKTTKTLQERTRLHRDTNTRSH